MHTIKLLLATLSLYFPVMGFAMSSKNQIACFSSKHSSSHNEYETTARKMKQPTNQQQQIDRRSVIHKTLFSSIIGIQALTNNIPPSVALENSSSRPILKPYAPLDSLLPAARFKKLLDRSLQIATDLTTTEGSTINQENRQELINELNVLLLTPQNYTRSSTIAEIPKQPAKQYIDSYRQKRNELPILAQPGAMLVQMGEVDTWKRLKRKEKLREQEDEIRAALNVYTSNLNFDGNRFAFTASKEERSKLIREDNIPDVKTVIASDMGMRYLYRNLILEFMDEARAELRYQLERNESLDEAMSFDAFELRDILLQAKDACDKWFGLIDDGNVRDAMDEINRET